MAEVSTPDQSEKSIAIFHLLECGVHKSPKKQENAMRKYAGVLRNPWQNVK